MELHDAEMIARRLVEQLAPACLACVVAGSIRRWKPDVKDIEIVCVPSMETAALPDLFGFGADASTSSTLAASRLDPILDDLKRAGVLSIDPAHVRNGPKYKRYLVQDLDTPAGFVRIALDLFLTDADSFGNILAIRTGNAEFSRALVTQRRQGGLMPSYLSHHDGRLWNGSQALCCPDEATFFSHLWLPAEIDPATRDEATARRLARATAAGHRA